MKRYLLIFLLFISCRKWVIDDLDYLSKRAVYNQKVYTPIMGRTTLFTQIFNTDNSSTPINFKILNVRYKQSGKPTKDLEQTVEAVVWKQAYTGWERSLEEIIAKRSVETHPIWEVRPTSGDFLFWANTALVAQPDSGYLFDVEASNSGGRELYENLNLMPFREQPYSPYEYDPVTGKQKANYPNSNDSSIFELQYNHPGINNITNDDNSLGLSSDSVRVHFHKTGPGHSLTFRFMDKDSLPIDPAKFNLTPWDSLVHGFDRQLTSTGVTYQVAYPIPLLRYKTRFTTGDGSQAAVKFSFTRLGFGNIRQTGTVELSFSIYQEGDWEIIFYFRNNPRFRDE
jgi:hypothetical protein